MNKSFDVFLSHNSKDKPAVRELAEALRARRLKVWLDEWELVPGQPWQEALEEIIETTQSAAVLVGKDGLGPWQDAEMRGCLSEFVERKLPVIPVLLPGAPEVPRLPFFLKRFTWVDLRGGLTEEGLDRLQWGVTGKRPDSSKLPSIPTAATEAAVTAAESQPVSAGKEGAKREAKLKGVHGRKKAGWGVGIVAAVLVVLAVPKLLTLKWGPPSPESGNRVPIKVQPALPPKVKPGTVIAGPLGLRFRYVPDGTYTIGSPEGEVGRGPNEIQHSIKFTRGFWLGETEITQAQWSRFMPQQPPYLTDCLECPVRGVSWFEAVVFANRLSDGEGLSRCYQLVDCKETDHNRYTCESATFAGLDCPGYRLPTEAEWEVAARAGTTTAVYAPELKWIAWYDGRYELGPHPVGQKQANVWGFRDLLGNVHEWTADWYNNYPTSLVLDPIGASPSGGWIRRVWRGGSWISSAEQVRAAFRGSDDPSVRVPTIGFRLVRGQELR